MKIYELTKLVSRLLLMMMLNSKTDFIKARAILLVLHFVTARRVALNWKRKYMIWWVFWRRLWLETCDCNYSTLRFFFTWFAKSESFNKNYIISSCYITATECGTNCDFVQGVKFQLHLFGATTFRIVSEFCGMFS